MKRFKKNMTDEEFGKLLTKRMKQKGIPYFSLGEMIKTGRIYGRDVPGDTAEERSMERWLEQKAMRDEIVAATGRIPIRIEDIF